MSAPICQSCLELPPVARVQIAAGTRALTPRGEQLNPAKLAQTYKLCLDCADYIWAQLAA